MKKINKTLLGKTIIHLGGKKSGFHLHQLSQSRIIFYGWKRRAWFSALPGQLLDRHHDNSLDVLLHGEQSLDVVGLGVAVDRHPKDQLQEAAQVSRVVVNHL